MLNTYYRRFTTILFIAVFILVLGIDTSKTILLDLNGEYRSLDTTAITLQQLLQQENISIRAGDHITPDISSWLYDGDKVSISQSMQIIIQADGNKHRLLSTQRKPKKLLDEIGLKLHPQDQFLVNGLPVPVEELLPMANAHSLQVLRAHRISLNISTENQIFYSTAATLGQALWEHGISLYEVDKLDPPPDTPLNSDIQADLLTSHEVLILIDEDQLKIRTNADTVGESLALAGIPIQGLDYTSPPPDTPLPIDGQVRLVRVEETITLETEPIPFTVEYQPLSDLEIDNRKSVKTGHYGITVQRIRIRWEDGAKVSYHVEDEFISRHPQPQIIGYGTKIVPRTLDTPDGSFQYWRSLQMYAVSYNPTSAGGDITASGLPLRKGLVAVDPRYIPLGTRMYVPGYGDALAADTGGGVRGRMIDLGYSDDDYEHWSSWVTVYFLWPLPENIVWIIP